MNASYRRKLEKNITKYAWYKIFTKRVYLPLITIQLVTVGKVTLEELAIIVIVSSIIQAVLQMPASYFADKVGNRTSIILGASIAVTSPLFYVFLPNFWGGLIASILFFGGYAFQSGAIEAFIHNTLISLKKEKDYAKIMGRAQTYGLIGNVILISLVPATYAIHSSLPFILGFLSLVAMLALTLSFVHPKSDAKTPTVKNPIHAVRSIVTAENILLFVFCGILAGVSFKGGEFRELLFQDIGIAVGLFGVLVALSSIAGAAMGWFIHLLDRLKPFTFYLFDLLFIVGCFILIGATTNPIVVVAGFTLFAGYTRVRMIIFQAKMLHQIKHAYKATLISALNVFSLFGDILAISLITLFVTNSGYSFGHVLFGFAVLGIGGLLLFFMLFESRARRRRQSILQ